jgi:hypothetical protein
MDENASGQARWGKAVSPWRTVSTEDWQNWRWQLKHRLHTPEQLAVLLGWDEAKTDMIRALHARFHFVVYGRGCNGICCQNGRPFVYPDEVGRIDANLDKFLPHLRPEARTLIEKQGYLSARQKFGYPAVRVAKGWCVFFNQGCVLQKIGSTEGDKFRYKPVVCALFPLERDAHDRWYVRQKGFKQEKWDLFCLDPSASAVPAAKSLQEEIALVQRFTEEEDS